MKLTVLVSFIALAGMAQPPAGRSPVDADGELILTERHIIAVHPSPPARQVTTHQGRCGDTRYRVAIASEYEDWPRRLRSVRVGRREIAQPVLAAIAGRIQPTMLLQSAYFDLCSDRADAARLRFTIIDEPGVRSRPLLLDVWIGRNGRVVDVRFN